MIYANLAKKMQRKYPYKEQKKIGRADPWNFPKLTSRQQQMQAQFIYKNRFDVLADLEDRSGE